MKEEEQKNEYQDWIFFSPYVLILLLLFSFGCKPKQNVQEKIVLRTDSTHLIALQERLAEKEKEILSLKSEINRFREENTSLRIEVSSNTKKYDTNKPIDPVTQKPPLLEEIETKNNTVLENKISLLESEKKELKDEIEKERILNKDLSNENKILKDENKELKAKVPPFTFWYGFLAGMVVIIIGILSFKLYFKR